MCRLYGVSMDGLPRPSTVLITYLNLTERLWRWEVNDEDLRDFFAGLVSISLVGRNLSDEVIAMRCYALADAMIEERNKPEESTGITAVKRKYTRKSNENHSTEN
jgi:hypothetical protein